MTLDDSSAHSTIAWYAEQHEMGPPNLQDRRFSVVSLFSGCGGLDLGFKGGFSYMGESLPTHPFDIVHAYDVEEKCGETYRQNIGTHFTTSDLSKIPVADLAAAEILIGGFPCQDFSSCGPRKGLNSERGRLYEVLISYMKMHRPKIVVGENVAHLARMDKGETLKKILADLNDGEYQFEVWSVFAPDYGVPQTRERLFLIGVRKDLKGKPEKPTPQFINQHRSIEWAIGDLETVSDETVGNQGQYFKANRAKKGHGQGDETCERDKPAYTIRANSKSRVQFHYSLPRRLTVRECTRVQTFPDSFVFPHSATSNMKQIGNAVPPLLAFQIAEAIARFLSLQD